jgi:hypothetical protein
MRRLFNALAVFTLVVSLSVPASAAPRRDDGNDPIFRGPIKRIVQLIKKFISAPTDDTNMSLPRP